MIWVASGAGTAGCVRCGAERLFQGPGDSSGSEAGNSRGNGKISLYPNLEGLRYLELIRQVENQAPSEKRVDC
jgi:hypothetical protein